MKLTLPLQALTAWALLLSASSAIAQEPAPAPAAPAPEAKPPAEAAPAPAPAPPPDGAAPAAPPEEAAPAPEAPAEAAPAPAPAPEATPAPAPAPEAKASEAPATKAEAEKPAAKEPEGPQGDTLAHPGYLPGYRHHPGLGLSPYSPQLGTVPGGVSPGYGASMPGEAWQFKWSGYASVSLQFSLDDREDGSDDQSSTVLHAPPLTLDEYASFTHTNTVPGNWVSMTFNYGHENASAVVSIDTWNPTRPTTYYQLGSQYFINNAFVALRASPFENLNVRLNVGYFSNSYGQLAKYGNGIYSAPLIGGPRGIGETTVLEYSATESLTGVLEHGVMGLRRAKVADGIIPTGENGYADPTFPAAYVHHLHLGLISRSETELGLTLHYLTNWSQEDRNRGTVDNPQTRQIDEANMKDGRINVFGFNAWASDDVYGYLGVGAAYIDAQDAYVLKGLATYAGEGDHLTDRWLGVTSGGTGSLIVAAINYGASIGKIVAYPTPFYGDGPDLVINTGFQIAHISTEFEPYDGKVRHKYGMDALYTFFQYMGAGIRVDRVVPSSKDSDETYHVLATRLQFKTDWQSHETVNLMYAKWFYGDATRNEGTGERSPSRLDDQLVALNYNMWW